MAIVSLALALGAGGLGCRGLLGIDEDVPLLAPGGEGGSDLDGGPSTTTDGNADANLDGGLSTDVDAGSKPVDRRYAVWPLPNTSPLLSQYDLVPETVTDKITGLVWQRDTRDLNTMSYPMSVAYCESLTLGSKTDWRLPTRIELLTTLDYGRPGSGLLNETVFPGGAVAGAPTVSWTASLSLLHAKLDERLTVDLYLGFIDVTSIQASSLVVRCVRGGIDTSPLDRYLVGNGVAYDVRTKVTWQQVPLPGLKSLEAAKTGCAALSLGGFTSGWRLPDIRELASLIDESRETVPLVSPIFAPSATPRYWSSTPRVNPATANYTLDIDTANIGPREFATETFSVRCVH